jgi:hypothetical protein
MLNQAMIGLPHSKDDLVWKANKNDEIYSIEKGYSVSFLRRKKEHQNGGGA